ncbi:MAG: DUF4230 domain-containing protein [Gammaproteobacteria bacterium]|nr:DUF4230 domain-containing protein [Gammaproteobacteria bacterium]
MEKEHDTQHNEDQTVPGNPDTGTIQRIFIILCVLLVVGVSSIFTWFYTRQNEPTVSYLEKKLSGFPIAELAVHEYTFEVFARASETRSGNFAYKILSAGLLDPDSNVQILYRCGVSIEYGVDLKDLSGRYLVTPDRITLELPPPDVVGKPRIINIGETASEVIAVKYNRLIRKPDTFELENFIRSRCQELAASWPKEFGLDQLARDRVRNLIQQKLAGHAGKRQIDIYFEDERGVE